MSEQTLVEKLPAFGKDYLHPCALHADHFEVGPIGELVKVWPSCPECGCMLEVEFCPWCGTGWLVFGPPTYDDVIRPAGATSDGDLMCANCAEEYEEEMEEQDEEEQDEEYWLDDLE